MRRSSMTKSPITPCRLDGYGCRGLFAAQSRNVYRRTLKSALGIAFPGTPTSRFCSMDVCRIAGLSSIHTQTMCKHRYTTDYRGASSSCVTSVHDSLDSPYTIYKAYHRERLNSTIILGHNNAYMFQTMRVVLLTNRHGLTVVASWGKKSDA